jgi:2-succinyl-5-enolpyruvyl-6-hydroxy-3-cyclohexene-1-carboxylate synthase
MNLDFRNLNTLWASVLVETLAGLGLETAVICPGSRSAPLAIAFAQHPTIEAIPVLDERSAGFFALGIGKRSGKAAVVVCTSGTAGANLYPAVIEARESRVPLLVLTADRPPELRECNAGQAIDQQKLYGSFPTHHAELATPVADVPRLAYLRQTILYAWEMTRSPVAGAVHLNVPFRDPLAPIPQPEIENLAGEIPANFFDHLSASVECSKPSSSWAIPDAWQRTERGIILAGVAQPQNPKSYAEAIAHLSKALGFPVLADGLSPVRNYATLNPHLISTYDALLRQTDWAELLQPQLVIRIGEMPTSKTLRQWLEHIQPRQWVIDAGDRNLDPLHLSTIHIRHSITDCLFSELPHSAPSSYLKTWLTGECQMRQHLDQSMHQSEALSSTIWEGQISWLLSQYLPERTPLFIANSTPIRDVDWFWQPGDRAIQPFANRGANGIDGTLSTALGIAHRHQSTVLLTGDLSLLHDTNGFLLSQRLHGHLTIVLINNNGGGIFELLPIAKFDPPFEEFFATPQRVNIAQLCAAYGIYHEQITSASHLQQCLHALTETGIRVLEIQCDRKISAHQRIQLLNAIGIYQPPIHGDNLGRMGR